MSAPVLATKLYLPHLRPRIVSRPHLLERLNDGVHRKLTLVSAAAGFGKTTLVSEWIMNCERPVAWLSLDEDDNDPVRFLTYFVAALQTIDPNMGEGVLTALQSPQPPSVDAILTAVLNEISTIPNNFIFVLDDYHLINTPSVDQVLTFLLTHQPPQMHLVIASREDPPLPLSRLRARSQLTELRAADLRFTPAETAEFLNQIMGLNLLAEDIAALENRTEGWIAGLQLAALALQGQQDAANFIQSFSGSHRFVLDYLVEEVLQQQPEAVQTFLLNTSILNRLCGSLCEAVLQDETISGQDMLVELERANLFIIPLDNERRWYRYHHLFGDLLRQRLHEKGDETMVQLHGRASVWFEENGRQLEAFQHAAAANDIERAERLIAGQGMPLHYQGAIIPVLNWLGSLDTAVLDAKPSLWVLYGSVLTMSGQPVHYAEEKLQAAEAALQNANANDETQDMIGQIAANRAMLAIPQNDVATIVAQSQRALEFLHPDNLPARTNATWTLGLAHLFQRNHAAAIQAFTEAIANSQAFGNNIVTLAAATCLGQVREAENQLNLAAQSYQLCLQTAGDPPWPSACEAALGLARVRYQWNALDAAEQLGQLGLQLSQQMESVDTPAACWMFLARLKLAQDDVAEAMELLANAEQFMRQHDFMFRMSDLVAVRVLALLQQGDLVAAADLANEHELPLSQARVLLAQGETAVALNLLASYRRQMEANNWPDELLKVLVLQAVAYEMAGEGETAVQTLTEALTMAEPGGFIRIFVDEGESMAQILRRMKDESGRPALSQVVGMKAHIQTLLDAFALQDKIHPSSLIPHNLVDPLSEREIEVVQLIAEGLTNRQIADRLYLSLHTVKVHARNIYSKLGVGNRTQAVARARELEILPRS